MRKRRNLFVLLLAIFSISFAATSNADVLYSKYQWPPMWNGYGNIQSQPLTHYAFDIVDTFNSGSTDYSAIRVMTPGPQPFCSSLSDAACRDDAQKYGWWIIRLLPPCTSANQATECIEGLSLTDKSGKKTNYVNSYIYKRNTFPAEEANGLGEGSGTSVWVDSSNPSSDTGFAVTVSGDAGGPYGAKSYPLHNFAATVVPYRTMQGDFDVMESRLVNRRLEFQTKSGSISPTSCIWISTGKCGAYSDFPSDAKLTLTLHLPAQMASWVLGRLNQPTISLTSISKNYDRVTVSAAPVDVPMVGGKVSLAEATDAVKNEWKNNNCPECEHGIWAVNARSSGENAFTIMNAFRPFMNDKSMVTIPAWSISSLIERSPSLSKCEQPGSISGLVTTNASAYQGAPPSFDGSTLNYKVGAMHYLDDGSIFKGRYELLMPTKTAQCLYNYSSAPISATVSVTSESGENNVATTVLSESDGWLHLAADGFTFSNPTIKVKFAKPASASPTPTATSTAKPAPSAQGLKVQWCAKGNLKKKVTALKPACPAGYKKIADPTAR